MLIRIDDLSGLEIRLLLQDHLQAMRQASPPCSMHALDLDGLRRPDVTVWSAWDEQDLLGCAALKQLDARHGEIKSMRTAKAHLRKGVARMLLAHMLEEATRRGYKRLSLETGAQEPFAAARALYLEMGFDYCEPFANYSLDPYSAYMTRSVGATP
ncbi:MAG: GNAT family N-acetyltransferase [Burkholderiaceae bacterium]